ncbi:MAG: hypothetical protein HC838_11090 [Spirulinaceae cyanobacterium RM2_2_10]|nr:hypothetical protein [Spirulinaceae cyanobacterium RM2_2_10]
MTLSARVDVNWVAVNNGDGSSCSPPSTGARRRSTGDRLVGDASLVKWSLVGDRLQPVASIMANSHCRPLSAA